MEIIIALVILVFLFKHMVLNVKINSVLWAIATIAMFYMKPELFPESALMIILVGLNVVDCIRDIGVSGKYYASIEDKIDGLFALKSVISVGIMVLEGFLRRNLIFCFIPRVIFLVLVYPLQYLNVSNDTRRRLDLRLPIPYHYWYYDTSRYRCYWYKKVLNSLNQNDKIISNIETVKEEFDESRGKVEKKYPKKLLEKIAFLTKEKRAELKELKEAKDKLTDTNLHRHMAYISNEFYADLEKELYNSLKSKNATFSPYVIKDFPEFKRFNLKSQNGIYKDTKWSDYFIIKILSGYVQAGEINDYACNDDDPLDNHSYGLKITSHNASDNPLLALDDD